MYELTCSTNKPARNASHSDAGGENLSEIITKSGGKILEENIQGDLNNYLFDIEPKKIAVLDKELRLKGLRCLIVKKQERVGAIHELPLRKSPRQKSPKVKLEELDKKLAEILAEKEVV